MSSADYVIVSSDIRKRDHGRHRMEGKALMILNLRIVKFIQRGGKIRKPKPTDVLLLCNFLPKNLEDLRSKHEGHYTLAIISNSDDNFVSSFKVKLCVTPRTPLFDCEQWYGIYVDSAATVMRIWDALNPEPAVFEDKRQHTIAKQNLYRNKQLVKVY